ncbi:MAG: complex I NDUFA9 subunit family protein [Gammaproteobacteria bacterium]|nr:complex I NDUFA9 subunit family protein [Gammaproteobacteria bacterium]
MFSIRDKRIVVFGGTGFIGRELITRLARSGAYVTLFARHPQRCQELGVLQRVRAVTGDVRDPLAVARALAGQHVAVNLVGVLAAPPKPMRALHVDWPARLAEGGSALEHIVHVSAAGANSSGPSRYLATKHEGEARLRETAAPWTILAPSVVFGPGDTLFNRFASLLRMAPGVMPVVRAQARFSPVYVGDVAEAVIAVLTRPDYAGQRIELGGPEAWTMRGILAYTCRQLGLKRLLVDVPDPLARLQGAVMGLLPGQPFSTDQYRSLTVDTDVGDAALSALGIEPAAVEAHVPFYLGAVSRQAQFDRFRREGGGPTTTP